MRRNTNEKDAHESQEVSRHPVWPGATYLVRLALGLVRRDRGANFFHVELDDLLD